MFNFRSLFRVLGTTLLPVAVVLGCIDPPEAPVVTTTAALTATSNQEILGFENAGHWAHSSGGKSLSTQRTQGGFALALASPINYTTIVSGDLTSNGPELSGIEVGTSFLIDLLLPVVQPNQWWFGAMQMFVSAPSRGVYNQYLGQVELTGAPLGVFKTWQFTFPDFVVQKLKEGPYNDLRLTVVLNVPYAGTGTYLLDNLRLKGPVLPVVECVTPLQGGTYRALFGYVNTAATEYHQPIGPGNMVTPGVSDRGQPTSFGPGTHTKVLSVDFSGPSLTWEVRGQAATASPLSPVCVLPPTVTPILECVRPLGGGQLRAVFGYENGSGIETVVPPSDENKITPGQNADRGQAQIFKTGRHVNAFGVDFNGSPLVWTLMGTSVTASSSSPPCPAYPPIEPILEGIQSLGDGRFKAYFGYRNDSPAAVQLPVGADNRFSSSPSGSRGQTTIFSPGRRQFAFAVESDGGPLTWEVAGMSETATLASIPVVADLFDVLPSVPTEINICREVLKRLWTPAKFVEIPDCRSTSYALCIVRPFCCLPKPLCLADPTCIVVRAIQAAPAYWNEGIEITCEIGNPVDEFYTALADVGFIVLEPVLDFLEQEIELTKVFANPIPGEVKAILNDLIALDIANGSSHFSGIDINSALVIRHDHFLAALWAQSADIDNGTTNALTLENLIILVGERYDALYDSSLYVTPEEFRNGLGDCDFRAAIGTLIHELVHVHQYRDLGSARFVEEYLVEIARNGYKDAPMEDEARAYKLLVQRRLPVMGSCY